MISLSSIWGWIRGNHILLIGLLEVLIGIVGFGLTIYGLRKTRSSVEASKQATRQTLQAMSDRLTIADIALIRTSMREIQVALRGNRWESALIRIQETRATLHQLKEREGFTGDVRRTEMQEMIVRLRKLQDRLERKLGNPDASLSVMAANSLLSDFIDRLSEWGEQMRFMKGVKTNARKQS